MKNPNLYRFFMSHFELLVLREVGCRERIYLPVCFHDSGVRFHCLILKKVITG